MFINTSTMPCASYKESILYIATVSLQYESLVTDHAHFYKISYTIDLVIQNIPKALCCGA